MKKIQKRKKCDKKNCCGGPTPARHHNERPCELNRRDGRAAVSPSPETSLVASALPQYVRTA